MARKKVLPKIPNPDRQLAYLAYINRENSFQHQDYDEEMKLFALMRSGDAEAVEESQRAIRRALPVGLSEDPLRNAQYLFVASITMATRFAIEAGMDTETAYNASDMYIRKMDQCAAAEEVLALHREVFAYFTSRMAGLEKQRVLSRTVAQCVEFIEANLHRPLRVEELAEQVNLSPGYLSTLFRKETGSTFSAYVQKRRIDTARNMLRYSDYSAAEISEILGYSSQSYFIRCFRKETGMTPREYRQKRYGQGLRGMEKTEDAGESWLIGK